MDGDAIVDGDLFEPALVVDDERVLAVLGVILGQEQRFIVKSGVDGEFFEAVRQLGALCGFGGVRVDVEEGRAVADGVESAQPANDDRLVVLELDAGVDLVIIGEQSRPLELPLLLLADVDEAVAGLLAQVVMRVDHLGLALGAVLHVEGLLGHQFGVPPLLHQIRRYDYFVGIKLIRI